MEGLKQGVSMIKDFWFIIVFIGIVAINYNKVDNNEIANKTEIEERKAEDSIIEQRLDKKIKLLNETIDKVDELETELAVIKGKYPLEIKIAVLEAELKHIKEHK